MNSIPIISIICPVYNAEKTVSRAIGSVIGQTFADWELICIDDGSTDGSPAILDSYADQDYRISVIHKQNAGVAMARHDGVNAARGKYSIHLDADDWVEPTMLEELYEKAEETNADMLICDYYQNYSDGREVLMSQHPTKLNTPEQIDDIFFGGFFSGLPMKLIRYSIYKKYDIGFNPGVNYCEDVLVCVQIMKHENLKIVHHSKAYYHYMMNDTSITHNVSRKTFDNLSAFKVKIDEILPENKYSHIRYQVALSQFVMCFPQKDIMSNSEIKELCQQLIPFRNNICIRYKTSLIFARLGLYDIARFFIKL